MDDLTPSPRDRSPRLPTVGGYAALVWSQIAVVLATTILGALIGFSLQRRVPPSFEASASIELPDVPTWVDTQPEDELPQRTTIDSTAQLVFSRTVLHRVAAATQITRYAAQTDLRVSAYPLSRVLIVTFAADTADLAVAGANEAAEALVDVRRRVLQGNRLRQARELAHRLNRLIARADVTVGPYNPISRQLRRQIAQISQVRAQAANDTARIVDDASPARRINQHGELQVTTGLMLGLLLGVAYAWWDPARRSRLAFRSWRVTRPVIRRRPVLVKQRR